MSCRKKSVKDVMRDMRERAGRRLTDAERKVAQVTAMQSTAYVCTLGKRSLQGAGGSSRRPAQAPWEKRSATAATVDKSRKRFEAKLVEAGATYNEPRGRYGDSRKQAGWHQDGVFLSKDPKEALRLLHGGG